MLPLQWNATVSYMPVPTSPLRENRRMPEQVLSVGAAVGVGVGAEGDTVQPLLPEVDASIPDGHGEQAVAPG